MSFTTLHDHLNIDKDIDFYESLTDDSIEEEIKKKEILVKMKTKENIKKNYLNTQKIYLTLFLLWEMVLDNK